MNDQLLGQKILEEYIEEQSRYKQMSWFETDPDRMRKINLLWFLHCDNFLRMNNEAFVYLTACICLWKTPFYQDFSIVKVYQNDEIIPNVAEAVSSPTPPQPRRSVIRLKESKMASLNDTLARTEVPPAHPLDFSYRNQCLEFKCTYENNPIVAEAVEDDAESENSSGRENIKEAAVVRDTCVEEYDKDNKEAAAVAADDFVLSLMVSKTKQTDEDKNEGSDEETDTTNVEIVDGSLRLNVTECFRDVDVVDGEMRYNYSFPWIEPLHLPKQKNILFSIVNEDNNLPDDEKEYLLSCINVWKSPMQYNRKIIEFGKQLYRNLMKEVRCPFAHNCNKLTKIEVQSHFDKRRKYDFDEDDSEERIKREEERIKKPKRRRSVVQQANQP
jgi:hypothetical protein